MKDLYNENINTLIKEIEEGTSQWKAHCRRSEESVLLKCPYYSKPYRFDTIAIKIPMSFLHRNRENNPKVCMEPEKTSNSRNSPAMKSKVESVTLSNFRVYDKAFTIKTV